MSAISPRRRFGAVLAALGASLFSITLIAAPAAAHPGAHDHHDVVHGNGRAGNGSADNGPADNGTAGNGAAPATAVQSQSADVTGPYTGDSDGSPSLNGEGAGGAIGEPCAGCVGNADDKNPPGQLPGGGDANNGYECDGNQGIGKSNPAHTGCTTTTSAPTTTTTHATTTTTAGPTTTTAAPTTTAAVLGVTVTRPVTTSGPSVLGVQLARTGSEPLGLARTAAAAMFLGGLCLLASYERRSSTRIGRRPPS